MNTTHRGRIRICLAVILVIAGTVMGPGRAQALIVSAGYDFYTTQEDSFIFDGTDLFGLQGVPIAPDDLGTADTIIRRLENTADLGIGESDVIDVELIALNLALADPITLGGTAFDVTIQSGSLLNDPASPFFVSTAIPSSPIGQMQIVRDTADGGHFLIGIPEAFLATFREVGNPANSFSKLGSRGMFAQGSWGVEPPEGVWTHPFAGAGNFYASAPFTFLSQKQDVIHTLAPSPVVPEPASFFLLGGGLSALWMRRRRRG